MSQDNPNSIPHADQYFGVPWAIIPERVTEALQKLNGLDLTSHQTLATLSPNRPRYGDAVPTMRDGVALISVIGTITKYGSSFGGVACLDLRRQVRAAAASQAIDKIVLLIDSPGGSSAGVFDLADDIAAAAQKKPVIAFIEDLGASAAYLLASQAASVYANASALVGSIGTYTVLRDTSEASRKIGVKVHVVRAGAFKGLGEPGSQVTDQQLAEVQRIVEAVNDRFLDAVARGRKMPRGRLVELADGRVHPAEEAKTLGLIDSITTLDAVLDSSSTTVRKEREMGTPTINELKNACPGADSDFLLGALEQGLSIQEAQAAWIQRQQGEIARLKAGGGRRPGVEPCGVRGTVGVGGAGGGVIEEVNRLVEERVARGETRSKAMMNVCKMNPSLHEEYLVETNAHRGEDVVRKIRSKFAAERRLRQ